MGNQIAQLMQMVTGQQAEITALKGKNDMGWSGIMDRKHMLPGEFRKKEQWKEWADAYIDYMEEVQPLVAQSLERAKVHPDVIEPTYPTPEDRKLAKSVYKTLKKLVKEADGKKLVRTFRNTHNIYELWRLLWFTYRPETAATVTAEARLLLKPPKIHNLKDVLVKLTLWETKLEEYTDQHGEDVMNEITKKEVFMEMLPDVLQARLRDVLELNPKASISELWKLLVNKVRYNLGMAAAQDDRMQIDGLADEPAERPHPDRPAKELEYEKNWQWDEESQAWVAMDSLGWKPKGAAKGKGLKGKPGGKGGGKKGKDGKNGKGAGAMIAGKD